jgi:ribonuclease-3
MAGGRQKRRLLSGLLEALVAAMYVEGGLEQAERFIYDFVLKGTDQIADWELADPKSRINEYFQKNFQTVPLYAVRDLTGHDHERRFKVVVCKPNAEVLAWGEGKSKKEAEEDAALNALEELQNLVQS